MLEAQHSIAFVTDEESFDNSKAMISLENFDRRSSHKNVKLPIILKPPFLGRLLGHGHLPLGQ